MDLLERKNALTPTKGFASSPPALGSGSMAGRYRLVGEILHSWEWLKAPLTEIPLAPEFEILSQ